MKKGILLLISIALTICSFGQDFTLYNLQGVYQQQGLNPAFIPDHKITIGLPALSNIGGSFENSGFKLDDIIQETANDSLYLDLNALVDGLKDNNILGLSTNTNLFSLGIKTKTGYISFNIQEHGQAAFQYSKDFISFFVNGNGESIGQTLQFDLNASLMHYRSFNLGIARKLSDKVQMGLTVKYLKGFDNLHTSSANASLYTDPDNLYDITATANIEMYSTLHDSPRENYYVMGSKNNGFGADLGIVYNHSEKFQLSASLLDIGQITWKDGARSYTSHTTDAKIVYQGIPIDAADIDSTNFLEQFADSLAEVFKVDTFDNVKYTTGIGFNYHVQGSYLINEKQQIGLHFASKRNVKSWQSGIALSYSHKVNKWFTATGNYGIYGRSYANIGLGFAIKGGPIQWYTTTDNILGLMTPDRSKYFTVRTGINLVFKGKSTDVEREQKAKKKMEKKVKKSDKKKEKESNKK